ncbi:MAG: PIN domain-containing protein [Kiritimatiellia bacterium]
MAAEVFLDSNILLYACSNAAADAEKKAVASRLILETDFGLSAQVMQEFIANALRKKELGISESGINAAMELCGQVQVLPVTRELVISAILLRRQFQLSHWDITILAAARELGCHTLYSEDFNPGQDYDGVQDVNPFH